MKKLIDFFADKQVNSILDVGTGTGDFIAVLKEICPKARITGIDPNTESLKEAALKYPGVAFTEMDAEKLGFDSFSFDLASISMALHHLTGVQKALKEMQRVVKPGGWIIVNELFSDNLNKAQEVHKMFHHFRSRIDRLTGVSHFETYQKKQVLQTIKEAGIKVHFHFDYKSNATQVLEPEDLESRLEKMRQHLEKIKGTVEYEILKPQIGEFREKAVKYGFQPATRIVIVGSPGR